MKYLLLVLALLAAPVSAAPRMILSEQGVTITLFDEPCAFAQVANMPFRATWQQDGKTAEGCFGVFPESEAIGAWFDDKSVAVIPMRMFRPVVGI